jgi:hypothetical protein
MQNHLVVKNRNLKHEKVDGMTNKVDSAAVHGSPHLAARVSKEELRRHWLQCVKDTPNLPNTEDAFKGFICGFRVYEKMATALGFAMTDADSRLFVPRVG